MVSSRLMPVVPKQHYSTRATAPCQHWKDCTPMRYLWLALKTLRLSILRVGIGWMFALLTFNFNRISIADLGASAIVITTLIGMHHFLSPFQVFWGRLADRLPLLGYRRTPYIALSALLGSLLFLLLPTLAVLLSNGGLLTVLAAIGVFALFGLAMAANGATTFALIAEITTDEERGTVVAITHTFTILSGIVSAGVAAALMPDYDPALMQHLYNLTPLIVLVSLVLSLPALEPRLSHEQRMQLAVQQRTAPIEVSGMSALTTARALFRSHPQIRTFFLFMLLAIIGIFLQDAILEVFGREVFDMSVGETTRFTQTWGAGVLLGMLLIAVLSLVVNLSKKLLATVGGLGTAAGLAGLAVAAATQQAELVTPVLATMGLSIGLFNVGALSLMMEMKVAGHTGLYMGLWGMAQGLGTGLANIGSGALHSGLIATGLLAPAPAYTLIFGFEAVVMLTAIVLLQSISRGTFTPMQPADLTAVVAFDNPA